MSGSRLFRCALLALLPLLGTASASAQVDVDGRLDEPAWGGARVVASTDDYQLRRIDTADSTYLGLARAYPGPALLLIPAGEALDVGHVGSALGRARYRDQRLIAPFRWSLRDPATRRKLDPPGSYGSEQSEFYQDAGWVASTSMMGQPGEMEIRLDRRRLDERWVLVLPMTGGGATASYYPQPPPPSVATVVQELLHGHAPLQLGRGPGGTLGGLRRIAY